MTLSKIEFIQQHFPEYIHVDPRMDFRFVYKVSKALLDSGFYKRWREGIDDATVKLILRAQGKYKNPNGWKHPLTKDKP